MRILHIVGTISPAAGGPTEVIRMLIRYAPEGIENELVTTDDPASPFLRAADGSPALPFPVHALGTAQKSWYCPKLIPWLKANRDRFDGIIVHGLWEITGFAVFFAHGSVPYVVFPHGMLDPYFKRTFPAKHLKKWAYWLPAEYWVLRGAARVLFTTNLERDLARQSFWLARWKPMVVALGSEPPPADANALLTAFQHRLPELFVSGLVSTKANPPDTVISTEVKRSGEIPAFPPDDTSNRAPSPPRPRRFLLFLGRIHPKKGCDLLLHAFAAIAHADPGLHLVMAGPDPSNWQPELSAIVAATGVADRVHWPGILLGDAKWGAFAACEAFVLTSHQENFGIAVVEALASGKPVLISDQVNIAPEVAKDSCGLVEDDSPEGARKLLERWIALPAEERTAMSHRAWNTFTTRYDMRRNTAAILSVFSSQEKP